MPIPVGQRSDFVLGMSLAEIFLLMVFIVLLVYVSQLDSIGGTDATVEVVILKKELEILKKESVQLKATISDLKHEIRDLNFELDELAKMIGAKDATLPVMKSAVASLKRGAPPC